MPKFRSSPSHRRHPSPTAKWLVTGLKIASDIQYGRRTTYMLPVKPNHHRRRFHEGQRLSLKAFVGGSTLAHVVVSDAQRIQLGQLDYSLVRELGYVRLDQFQVAWVEEHDQAWTAKLLEEFPDHVDVGERFCRKEDRFQARHAHREVWVIRFAVDRTDSGGLLAAKSEEGYTDSVARALPEEMPAVRGFDWELHIGRHARDREARRQAMLAATRAALTTEQRVTAARRAAASKGLDMRSEFRLYDRHVRLERVVEALRQLELIESRVFPQRRAA
jgi:hypothetical protein